MDKINVKLLHPNARVPTYGSVEAAGADIYVCIDEPVEVMPGCTVMLPTGFALEVPKGCAGLIFARSSMGAKRHLAPANKVGVIDSDYRGEVKVALHNHGLEPQTILPGERIAQLVIVPVFTPGFREAAELDDTDRGIGGFGSTGK